MKKFKDFLVEFDTPTIYCDMDGVLADFVKFTSEHLGQKFSDENWHRDCKWMLMNDPERIFR